MAVRLRPDPLQRNADWPVRLTVGCETLTLAIWVRFPYGSLNGQVAELEDARRSERRAREGMRVRLSPWLLERPELGDQRLESMTSSSLSSLVSKLQSPFCCGWASAQRGLISLARRVRLPDPLLDRTDRQFCGTDWQSVLRERQSVLHQSAEYANRQSGHVEGVAILQVRLLPRSLERREPGAQRLE